ncbi:PREDICTED: integrator complex subunit 6-B [Bactrocera latifrons]|uniref:integrator complex subunit 6-B n=1 Tax=Bactrocera latifrons TaxID=174628 RepID=UPI0008DE2E5D|nr:PREDICTED: integrator complex subunit 6-B [Bactrocera latifrons]XP_018800437.1 PREDICTED: integrator complex subunit 6-B [Bactrocera latifrons]XP_018800438.1 PREDICTED: integrator complex subunit 6-B [Bactrocera latifrons]XP_018800440.1 PREDICTED: integrator complex subunit 6-B [Bactrocera latifrons]XP_018800441.1 PREDICTED: integrator complex subunit 6-B [Bactrocera latifrons]
MTIILFLVDTSASMCQKAYVNGVQKSYLDIAKGAVETFLKYRQRTQDCLGDRYMLLTFEEPPANVKAGWKENHATFMNELKNLQSNGLTSMGESLKNAFDLLNLNRMQSGIDTYGQGRCPFYLEPSVIIVITDGGRYSYRNGVHQDIILPLNTQIPGTNFTKEPFRWDQRLFSLVLRMPGNKVDERAEGKVPHDDSPIERMCVVTGGRSYRVRSHYVLNQCIESLVQKVQPGVVLQFEPMLPKDGVPNEALQDIIFQPMKKMIYVQKHISQKTFPIGYWPLPEPYWPDPKAVTLPPRDAHPKLKVVTPAVDEPQMVRSFPVDKYEIEGSPLTLQILQKREMNKCWQVIISNGMHGFDLPFGYLKASQNLTQVHLYVLAYNYPALLPLLHDLIHKYNMSPPNDLMYKFNAYVRSIPPYYCPFLRKALLNINVPYQLLQFLLPENVDNYLSPNIANQLKHIKNTAKQDQENLCMKVYKQLKQPKPPYRQIETAKLNPGVPLRRDLVRHPLLRETFSKLHAEIEPLENYTIVVPQLTRQSSAKSYRNPFDIPRRDLMEEIARMRETVLRPTPTSLVAKDSGHCLPIAEMGNYQEYLKNKDNPLREIEPTNVRQHMFGNPYKKDKHMVMVDEADLSDVAPMKSNNGAGGAPLPGVPGGIVPKKIDASRARKRKAGPIRKDYIFRRTSTDVRPSTPSLNITSANASSSSVSSMSDFDDDSASETASISSNMSDDGDPDRLVVAFDFSEDEPGEPLINGYVRNFINGISDESSCDSDVGGSTTNPISSTAGISMTVGGTLPLPPVVQMPGNNNVLTPMSPPGSPQPYINNFGQSIMTPVDAAPVAVGSIVVPNVLTNTNATIVPNVFAAPLQINGNTLLSIPTTTPALGAPVPVATPATVTLNTQAPPYQHNDINDAQEISRILQQCHNGNAGISNTAAAPNPDTAAIVGAQVKMETAESVLMPPPSAAVANSLSTVTLSTNFDTLKRESMTNNVGIANSNHVTNHNQHNSVNSITSSNNIGNGASQRNSIVVSGPPPLTDEQRDAARKHNLEIRTQVFRDIRRPGRNYTQLLEHLNLIKGDFEMKSNFIKMCISESLRFRRKQMIDSIQEWWDKKQQQLHTTTPTTTATS